MIDGHGCYQGSEGWAYLKLNDLEEKVVQTELSRTLNVAWKNC